MVKDAEAHADEDKKRREAVDAKNHADALVHSTEKALAEHGSKVGETERRAIEAAVSDLKEALKGDDAEAIKAKTNTLAQASMKLGEAMYKQQAESRRGQGRCQGRRGRRGVHRGRRRQEQEVCLISRGDGSWPLRPERARSASRCDAGSFFIEPKAASFGARRFGMKTKFGRD